MPIHALENLAAGSTPAFSAGQAGDLLNATKREESSTFRQALAMSKGKATGGLEEERVKAHQAAEQFVSTAFIQPLLAQMQKDPLRTKMFHGGFAEDAFQSKLDTILSDRIVSRMSTHTGSPTVDGRGDGKAGNSKGGMALVDAVYRRIIAPAERRAGIKTGLTRQGAQPPEVSLHG